MKKEAREYNTASSFLLGINYGRMNLAIQDTNIKI